MGEGMKNRMKPVLCRATDCPHNEGFEKMTCTEDEVNLNSDSECDTYTIWKLTAKASATNL